MSGGAAVRAIPADLPEGLDIRSKALNKKSDMSSSSETKEKCTCPNKCELHPKKERPLELFYKEAEDVV